MSRSKYELRRMLVRASILLPFASLFPAAKSEPIFTATMAAKVIPVILKAMAAVAQARSDKALRANVEAVLASIQTIIEQQEVIITELKKIQKLIVESNLRSWQNAYSNEIDGFAKNLRVNLAELNKNRGKMTRRLEANFNWIANDCSILTNALGKFDPFSFIFFVTGVAVVFVCEEVLKGSSVRLDAWRVAFLEPVNRWLDAKRVDSMPAILAQTVAEIQLRKQKLADRPPEYVIGTRTKMYSPDGTGDESCVDKISDIVTITGDYATGFSGVRRSQTTESRCRTRVGREPRERLFAAPSDFAPATPSEFPYINDLNAERDQIRNLELAEVDQRVLLGQMVDFQKLLSSSRSRHT
jgi:hypothetical protein